jgi:radical SAM superfamily enzyme YgiQ (UPF0313 family)
MNLQQDSTNRNKEKPSSLLFTHSYFLRFDPKQWKNAQPYAPLGTIYAAAVMREAGHTVALHDVQFTEGPEEIRKAIEDHHPSILVIYDDGFNYLTKMCLTNMREAAFRMIAIAKESGCTVIVSSSDATDHYEKYLEAGADFILLGEAEQTLLQLAQAIDSGVTDFMSIPGMAYLHNGALVKTVKRAVLRDLDSMPLPAWDLINIKPYRDLWMRHAGYFSINIGTTRGCPFKCNWCAKPIYGNRYNARSPQNVVAELKWILQLFSFDHIWFCDDIFGLKPGWVNEFADLVKKEGLKFRFKIQSRADLLLQEKYVEALARAGCEDVWMGAESGSQKILDAMDKGTTVEQIAISTALLKQHNIRPSFFIQFGYPGETNDDIQATIDMIHNNQPHQIGISVSYPLPGTVFYEKVKEQLKEKANWTDSDELALMFHNTYKPSFYKQLHRYVHRNYRRHMAQQNLMQIIKQPWKANVTKLKKALSGIYLIPLVMLDRRKLKEAQKPV